MSTDRSVVGSVPQQGGSRPGNTNQRGTLITNAKEIRERQKAAHAAAAARRAVRRGYTAK